MYEIRLTQKFGSPRKRIGKLIVTRQWQECDKFIASKAAPFEGSVFDLRAATGKGRKVTIPETPKKTVVEIVGKINKIIEEAVKVPAPDVDPKTGFIKTEPVPGVGEDKNVLVDGNGEVVDEAIMLVPDEPKEEPKGPEEIEGVKVIETEAPESDEPEAEVEPETEKPPVKKAKKKGGSSGKRKR